MSLRPDEQRLLASVEDQLSRDDPALADLFVRHPPPTVGRERWWSALLLGLLLVVLVVLVLVYPLAALRGPAAVGLLTAVLIVPWMAACTWALAHGRTSQPGRSSSAHRNVGVGPVHRPGHDSTTVVSLRCQSGESTGLSIGLIVGAVIMALIAGGMQIALLVIAVVLLCAAHVLRWRARRALFRRIRGFDTDG
jgi:Flp pilus assembly protein TadB